MVDYCFQQNIQLDNCNTDNLLSDPESSCRSADLNSLFFISFDKDPIAEEMINNVCFSQNDNNSSSSLLNNQIKNQMIYNLSPYSSLDNSNGRSTEISGVDEPIITNHNLVNNSRQNSEFNVMVSGRTHFANNELQQQISTNSANPLLSYSNHLDSNEPQRENDLVRIQNECISVSPTCSNISTVSSTHTLPSFMDTYSSNKLNTINSSLIQNENLVDFKNILTDNTTRLQTNLVDNVTQMTRTTINSDLNNLNSNNIDDNHFDSDNLLYEFESPLNRNDEFVDDQSYSNSSLTNVNLSTPTTTSAELDTIANCQSNQLFNLSASNFSSSLLVNTPVSTPLNDLLSNCSSPSSSITDGTYKSIKFKQEPVTIESEYDCNSNLIKHQLSDIYSSNVVPFTDKPIGNVAQNDSLSYNDFNSLDLDSYAKNGVTSNEMKNCTNNQSITILQSNHSMSAQQPFQMFDIGVNKITHQSQLLSTGISTINNKCTTISHPTNKRSNIALLNTNQINQLNKNTLNNMCPQANQLKLIQNQSNDYESSPYKTKQINRFAHQLNNTKYRLNSTKTSLVCLVCGDQANCCHYKVITCEGCKGFFKRTVQKSAKYTCLGNKDCIVDKRRRNRCQYCRFQKCLQVGMIKEVVRTDSLKGRRGRLPSKAKFLTNVTCNSPPIEFIRPLFEKLIKNYPTLKKTKQTLYQNENDCLEFSNSPVGFNKQFSSSPLCNNSGEYLRNGQYSKQQIIYQFKQSALKFTKNFAHQIPNFNELDEEERKTLITNSSLEVFTLFFAYRHALGSAIYEFDENFRLSRTEVAKIFGQWFNGVEEFMGRLINMQIDLLSFTYLLSIVILYGYNDSNSEKVEKIQNKLVNSLKEFTDKDIEAQKKPSFFPKLISLLPDLKNLKSFMEDYQSNIPLQLY